MKQLLLSCLALCLVIGSYTQAMTYDQATTQTTSTTTTSTEPTYETLPLNQQQFIDGFVNSLYYKMNYQTDPYYIQDIINDLTKLKTKQPKLKNLIIVTIERLKSNYSSDLALIETTDQNDGLDAIRTVTTNKQYIISKKQFIKLYKDKALQLISNYSYDPTAKKNIAGQIKNQIDSISGSLTKQETADLKKHVDSLVSPIESGSDYSTILSNLNSISAYNNNAAVGTKFVEGSITDSDITYTISSKPVEYTGSVVIDLFTNTITRFNSNINFNVLPESSIKATVANGTIIQVLVSTTNISSSSQILPSGGSPIIKDSKNNQHVGSYYANNYGFIKPKETIVTPFYFIIEKGATVDYVAYQGPFTTSQGIYLVEKK